MSFSRARRVLASDLRDARERKRLTRYRHTGILVRDRRTLCHQACDSSYKQFHNCVTYRVLVPCKRPGNRILLYVVHFSILTISQTVSCGCTYDHSLTSEQKGSNVKRLCDCGIKKIVTDYILLVNLLPCGSTEGAKLSCTLFYFRVFYQVQRYTPIQYYEAYQFGL